ncbi:hypothetical protein [Dysgonomonas sp.]
MKQPKNCIKNFILIVGCVITSLSAQGQVTIGSNREPDKDALLDLRENEDGTSIKGFFLPRVYLQKVNLPSPLTEHQEGMFVYNLTENTALSLRKGVYFNDGYRWHNLFLGSGRAGDRLVLGNDAVTPVWVAPEMPVADGFKLVEAASLTEFSSVVVGTNDGTGTYDKGTIYSNSWHPIFETNIDVSNQQNRLFITAQVPYQSLETNLWVSYAVGLFVNDRLEAVRVSAYDFTGDSPFAQETVIFSAEDLAEGVSSVKLCFLRRNSSSTTTLYVGMSVPSASNANDFMLRPAMSYYFYEMEELNKF